MFSLRERYSNKALNILHHNGSQRIKEMKIFRYPLNNALHKAVEIASGGASKIYYDQLFHLGLVMLLENDKMVLVEKNEEVEVTDTFSPNKNTDVMPVQLNKDITLHELMEKTQKYMGNKNFFDYTPLQYNCQNFVMNVLKANGLWKEDYKDFVYQSMTELVENIPNFTQSLAKALINTKAWINKIRGTGLE